jgi:hypothetical protein
MSLLMPISLPRLKIPKITNVMAELLGPILSIDDMNSLVDDSMTTAKQCDFWKDIEIGATKFLGYAAPGTVLTSNIPSNGDPSRNYNSPSQPPPANPVGPGKSSSSDSPMVSATDRRQPGYIDKDRQLTK